MMLIYNKEYRINGGAGFQDVESLITFLEKVIELKDEIRLNCLNIGILKTYHWSSTPLKCFKLNKKLSQLFLNLIIKITHETSINSLIIGQIELSKEQIEYLQFWFIDPFGEFGYDNQKKILQLIRYKIYDTKDIIDY